MMTTIAWDGRALAADTQSTDSGELAIGRVIKIGRRGRVLFGSSGSSSYVAAFLDWGRGGFAGDPPKIEKDEGTSSGFVIMGERIVEWFPCGRRQAFRANLFADGSGYKLAIGAMEAGASAEQAVRIASKYDIHTGGEITVLTRE